MKIRWKVINKNVRREEKAIKDLLYEQLIKREQCLRDLKQNLETSIQNAPSGNLKIINCRGVEQYYLDSAETRTSYPNGKYLRKSDFELASKHMRKKKKEEIGMCQRQGNTCEKGGNYGLGMCQR